MKHLCWYRTVHTQRTTFLTIRERHTFKEMMTPEIQPFFLWLKYILDMPRTINISMTPTSGLEAWKPTRKASHRTDRANTSASLSWWSESWKLLVATIKYLWSGFNQFLPWLGYLFATWLNNLSDTALFPSYPFADTSCNNPMPSHPAVGSEFLAHLPGRHTLPHPAGNCGEIFRIEAACTNQFL